MRGSGSKHGDNRQVATWAKFFQNNDEQVDLGSCEIGQYSCSKLLREIEAVDSEANEEASVVAMDDVEMICLPDDVCAEISSVKWIKELPEDIYTLLEMTQCPADQVVKEETSKTDPVGCQKKGKNRAWVQCWSRRN
jgi:hypothetical protein